MQNSKWPSNAGADHWNVCVAHNSGLILMSLVSCRSSSIKITRYVLSSMRNLAGNTAKQETEESDYQSTKT